MYYLFDIKITSTMSIEKVNLYSIVHLTRAPICLYRIKWDSNIQEDNEIIKPRTTIKTRAKTKKSCLLQIKTF